MGLQDALNDQNLRDAANGGDYRAIFMGKKLAFKAKSAGEKAKDLVESAMDLKDKLGDVSPSFDFSLSMPSIDLSLGLPLVGMPSIGMPSIDVSFQAVVNKIKELVALINRGAKSVINEIKEKFMGLVNVFVKLKECLLDSLGEIMKIFQMTLEAIIDLLVSLVPDVFVGFISSLIASILPFIGQIKAVGDMLKSIGMSVKNEVKRRQIAKAGTHIANNDFTNAARNACTVMINEESRRIHAETAISTANCVVSVSGLAFTGGVASTVGGIASAIAKLSLQIASIVIICKGIEKGNNELGFLQMHPTDLHPVRLFNANPILGAHYLSSASTSNIAAFEEISDTKRFGRHRSETEMQQIAIRICTSLSPLVAKARQFVIDSPLDLTANPAVTIGQMCATF